MKLQLTNEDWVNHGTPPTIHYKAKPIIGKNLTDESDSLKVNIKANRERVKAGQ